MLFWFKADVFKDSLIVVFTTNCCEVKKLLLKMNARSLWSMLGVWSSTSTLQNF
jgi:hypothetical protein